MNSYEMMFAKSYFFHFNKRKVYQYFGLSISTYQIQEIKRFSEEYFTLVQANTPDENTILAAQQTGEELLVRFRGQAYLVK